MKKNKPYIKFFKKSAFVIIPVYFLWFAYIEFMPMYYNRPNNTRWYFIKESLDKTYKIPDARIIFLGESRVNAGIDFKRITNAYSFASGGATPVEMYHIFMKYLESHSKPDTVFISFSPRFLTEAFAFWPYAVRNDLFTFTEFKRILNHTVAGDTVLGPRPKFKFLLHKLNYLEYWQSDVVYNHMFAGYNENSELIIRMQSMKGGRPHPNLTDSCSELNHETRYEHFDPNPLFDHYLHKLLDLCQTEGIFVIFEFMPMNESSVKALNPEFIRDYRAYMENLGTGFPNHVISDSIYAYPDRLFGDASHLNSKGKQIYTDYIIHRYFKPYQ
jgi:hypothetical protein